MKNARAKMNNIEYEIVTFNLKGYKFEAKQGHKKRQSFIDYALFVYNFL